MKGSPTMATPGSECASQVDSRSVPRSDAHTGSKELKSRVSLERVIELAETRDVRPIDNDHVERLSLGVEALPPIDVVKLTEARFGILAGYHRVAASRLAGKKTVRVVVHDLETEQWHPFAVRSNLKHGLPLTMAQRREAARRMLLDNPRRSDRDIAADSGLSAPTVGKLRHQAIEDDEPGVKDLHLRVGRDGKSYPVPPAKGDAIERVVIEQGPGTGLSPGDDVEELWQASAANPIEVIEEMQEGNEHFARAVEVLSQIGQPSGDVREAIEGLIERLTATLDLLQAYLATGGITDSALDALLREEGH
jgi:hypothetical protein